MNKQFALLGVILCIALCSAKVTYKRSLVVSPTEPPVPTTPQQEKTDDQNETKKILDSAPIVPKIYEMRVDTNVSNRYAKTLITSKVKNLNSKAQEATFSIVTPDKAFISGFTMEIDGKKYEAYVQEKEEAKQTYEQAVSSGQSAAHVAVSARDSNRFTVSVNVEPESKAIFYLRYEELLARKNEKYELVLNIHPGQPVKNLEVQVNIAESRPIKFVKAPSLRSGNEISKNKTNIDPEADIKTLNETSVIVTFKPDIIKQKLFASSLGGKEENGLSGQFVVEYDVVRDPQGGEVLVDGGYFVHFFAPEDLPPLRKQVVFVLDTSGSMSGTRITQLKEAMNSILGELKPEDVFSIVEFNSIVKVWNVPTAKVIYQLGDDPYMYYGGSVTEKPKEQLDQVIPPSFEATKENIESAKNVITKLDAYGGTDIQSALTVGLEIVARNKDPKSHQPIIVFLTDGEPTVGEFNTEKITSNVTELNTKKVPIFSLSFGDGADREFLQKLSLKNQGFARHIYEAADAYLQLEDFYKQISSPLLSDVSFKYVDNVKNVSRKQFPILFGGSELYITGIITDPGFLPPAVEGWGVHGPVTLRPKVYQAAGSLERLWAYLTVRQLLEQRDVAEDKKGPTQEALRLALKYSFVTDVSSLVVVKPNATSAVNTEDAAKGDDNNRIYAPGSFPAVPLSGGSSGPLSFHLNSAIPIRIQAQGSFPAVALSGDSGGALSFHLNSGTFDRIPGFSSGGGYSNLISGAPGLSGPSPYFGKAALSRKRIKPLSYATDASYDDTFVDRMKIGTISDVDDEEDIPVWDTRYSAEDDNGVAGASGWGVPEPAQHSSIPLIVGGTAGNAGGFGGYLTTPFPRPIFATSLQPELLSEESEVASSVTPTSTSTSQSIVDGIFTEILWLQNTLNENGTLTLESGTYSLGLNETIAVRPECHNSLNDTEGKCTLLHECPQIHKELTDLVTYKKYFCDLQSYAAVCCPVPATPVTGP